MRLNSGLELVQAAQKHSVKTYNFDRLLGCQSELSLRIPVLPLEGRFLSPPKKATASPRSERVIGTKVRNNDWRLAASWENPPDVVVVIRMNYVRAWLRCFMCNELR